MNRRVITGLCVLVMLLGTGCAQKQKQRLSMLEGVNQNLTERLNALATELDSTRRDRDEFDLQLQQSLAELDSVRGELARQETDKPTAPGWTPVPGGAMISIEGNVLFAPGKVAIRKEARRMLEAVVSAIQGEYADKDILVIGHTDDRPIKKSGWTDNYELSSERALSVVRYLADRGVSPSRLISGGCGEHRPRMPNSSNANRAANRRVEIYATTPLPRSAQP